MQSTVEPTQRRTAREIFEAVEDNAHSELRRSGHALAFSGFAGGLTMGLTGLGVASALAVLGEFPLRQFVAYLAYLIPALVLFLVGVRPAARQAPRLA